MNEIELSPSTVILGLATIIRVLNRDTAASCERTGDVGYGLDITTAYVQTLLAAGVPRDSLETAAHLALLSTEEIRAWAAQNPPLQTVQDAVERGTMK